MSGRLQGKVAAVTGSSRGIGRAVARAFLDEGAQVVVNSRDPEAAAATARELGGECTGVGADVATEAGAAALVGAAVDAYGRLDVLVNNAGLAIARPTVELSLADWQRALDLNMTGVFLCSREAARRWLPDSPGVIVNTASVQSFAGFPRRLAYGPSKAAVAMMTKIMAAEWAPGIRVNAVAPGYVRTEMTRQLELEGRIDYDAIARRTPLGRMAQPEELAPAYVYLASDESGYVTGETLVVDGGWLAFGAFEGV
jgi:NAD(P)-dependent dehydrogenase (short-subunit alcohol dehydrogenase family)